MFSFVNAFINVISNMKLLKLLKLNSMVLHKQIIYPIIEKSVL